jgi:ATP synthase protein I
MVPFNRPIPESTAPRKRHAGLSALVEAEKWMQIALVVPCSVGIGWLIGALLGNWLHQKWISIAGVVFGGISGLVYVVRMALTAEKALRPDSTSGNDAGSTGNPL